MSGADLEYQLMLARAGKTYDDRLDAARLEQLGDQSERDEHETIRTGRLSEENLLASYGFYVNIKSFGAVCDGVTDDSIAIQAALTYADGVAGTVGVPLGPTVFIPGRSVVTTSLTWGRCTLMGAGQRSSEIVWKGATTATVLTSSGGWQHKQLLGINFRSQGVSGATKPACWVDATSGSIDWGAGAQGCGFGDVSGSGTAQIRLGQVVNAHFRRLRSDITAGYFFEITHGGGGNRSFSLDDFTMASTGSAGLVAGIVNVIFSSNSHSLHLSIGDARVEASSGAWVNGGALVALTESVASGVGLRAASVRLYDIATELNTQTSVFILSQTTANTGAGSQLVGENLRLTGVTGTLGGTWTTLVPIPSMPTGGQIAFWSSGRGNSGGTPTNFVQFGSINIGTEDTQIVRASADVAAMAPGDSFRTDGTWNGGTFRFGNYRLWVDASGVLRIKNGAPANDTDGTVVGSQT